jgi:hypothetical protein
MLLLDDQPESAENVSVDQAHSDLARISAATVIFILSLSNRTAVFKFA